MLVGTTRNDNTSTSTHGSKSRKLRSAIWKEVEPIYRQGKLVQGRCIHCNEIFLAARNSGTSHIKRHLDNCEQRAKIQDMVEKLQSTTLPTEVTTLADWRFDAQRTRGELVRMIVLHELPFSLVEYDGFIRYSASLNPLFKMVCRTTIKMDSIEVYKNHRLVLRDMFKFGFIDFRLKQAFGDYADTYITRVDIALANLFAAYSSQIGDGFEHINQQSDTMSTAQGRPWSD
jgi:hypothetical protein